MAKYQRQTFVNNSTTLTAEHLNHIEDGIIALEEALAKYIPKETTITLLLSNWKGNASPYSQVVTIDEVTSKTRVDLLPTPEQLVNWENKNLSFTTENENGVVTVYAIGDKPLNDYTIEVVLTEVDG